MTRLQTLEMALEALEVDRLAMTRNKEGRMVFVQEEAITALRQQIALEKQQPADEPFGYFQYSMHMDAWVQNRDNNKGAAFYTRPQQAAQWVGLTDEEVAYIADSEWEEAFVRLVEAKLKEKNGG